MKIFTRKRLLFVLATVSVVFFVVLGCKKENTDCTAIIYAKYLNDTLVTLPYADVIIAPQYQDVRIDGKTDITCKFEHVFKYEGILDVVVYKVNTGSNDSVLGRGVIRLKPGETSTKTIFVK